jgi:carbamoyl-phosphate synthase large subunit
LNCSEVTTLLVTGVGDTVGQALVKAARQSSLPCRVIGTDRDEFAVGLQWVDKGFVLPHCWQGAAYLAAMQRVCTAEGVQLIFPGSEKELELLSRQAGALRTGTGAIVVGSAPAVLKVAMDKFETCRFLEGAGLRFPRYARADATDEIERLIGEAGFPLIAKPCRGTGSRGVVKVESSRELGAVRTMGVEMVLQEYLRPDEQEYSVEVYTLKNGRQAGAISYRRGQLIAGDTYKALVAPNEAVEAEAQAVAKALGPAGPCNVQLRVTDRGPVTFEINPRFSGGVSMRAHFGYNEVQMAIRDLVRDEPVPPPKITSGRALRFWEEMYLDDHSEAGARDDLSPGMAPTK